MSELIKYISELPGYKISDTHFRLGSKIHISHFYYAKRFFQNSFFASRLAFLITNEILTDHQEKISQIKTDGLTLIGYGLYSELLISLVEKFLKKASSSKKINHDLISDAEEPSFIKNYGDTYKYIVIIVPIASTFSTAIKIKNFLTDQLQDKEILQPYINVLYVSHSPSKQHEKPDENGLFKIEKNFGWTKKDGKIIYIKEFSTSEEKKQKYFLELKSEWHDVKNCEHCFPQENDKERPLYFTDKSSVTPTFIFGKPKARTIEENNNKFNLLPEVLQYGHFKRDANHFHYYIRIEDFFQKNIEFIKNWLNTLKKKNEFKNSFNETSRVIIIAPGSYSNTGFINLVNEKLFSNAANIIHYNTQNDHILNFGLLYGKELQDEDTKVVFVDDTITTGSTFRKINFYVENTFIEKISKVKVFDACVVLLDRSNHYVHKQVKAKTDKYFSFANLQLPLLKDFDGECPLDIGYKRYNKLANNSFLDRMKIHFLAQKDKLQERAIYNTRNEKSEHCDDKTYIRQVEALHRIYEWCRNPNHIFESTFENWKKSLFDNTKSPFSNKELDKNSTDENGLSNETATLLKMLTHSPLIHYKPIKDKVFVWVLNMLKEQIDRINNEISNGRPKYESFRDLKFLIRRAGLLNTNFLISKDFFNFLNHLYSDDGLNKLTAEIKEQIENISVSDITTTGIAQQTKIDFEKKQKSNEELVSELENIQDFHVFYTAQIKDLLFQNEARSIRLEKTLNKLKIETDLSDSFKQLLRFIQEENGILILNFWNFIEKKFDSINYNQLLSDNSIIGILNDKSVREHYRAKILQEFLSVSNEEKQHLHENIPFINFLKLIHFFEIERKEKSLKLNVKTDFIIEHLKNIICDKNGEQIDNQENNKSGAFFFVRYKKGEKPFLAYNKGSSGEVDETTLKQDAYLKEFLNPAKDDKLFKSIIEFHKKNGKWVDLYAKEQSEMLLKNDFSFIPEGYNRLLIVRFSKIKVELEDYDAKKFMERLYDEGQAIAGFYFNKKGDIITDITKTRYLLLLRSYISALIERHHENDEFRDWIEADNIRKLALLSGHGRVMLLKIAAKEEEGISYKDIVLNLEHLQMIVALDNNVVEITGRSEIKERFNKFYNVKGSPEIDSNHLKRLGIMAKQIFDFEEIENTVPCKIKVVVEEDIKFAFHKSLLDMMCFEILLNAKKNRWHFLADEKIGINNNWHTDSSTASKKIFKYQAGKTFSGSNNEVQQNQLEINTSVKNDKLVLKISNTGPKVDDDIINTLNKGQNPKKDSSIAGLKLLQALLSQDGFCLGKIQFGESPLNKDKGLFQFTVTLTLNAMNDVQR